MARLWPAIAAALLAVAGMACSPKEPYERLAPSATPVATATPTPAGPQPLEFATRVFVGHDAPPLPETVTIDAGDGVNQRLLQTTRGAMAASVDFFQREYGFDLATTRVVVRTDLDSFVDALAAAYEADGHTPDRAQLRAYWAKWGGTAFDDTIFLYPRTDRREEDTIAWLWEAVPHEATHLLQQDIVSQTLGHNGWRRLVVGTLPNWFVEGHAEFVGATVAAEYAPDRYAVRARTARELREISAPADRTLEEVADDDLGADGRNGDEYTLGYLAIDLLAGEDPLGLNIIAAWDDISRDERYWTDIFADHFGMTIDDFYARFEATRQEWR